MGELVFTLLTPEGDPAVMSYGLAIHLSTHEFDLDVVVTMIATALGLAMALRVCQIWESALVLTTVAGFAVYLASKDGYQDSVLPTGDLAALMQAVDRRPDHDSGHDEPDHGT